MTATPPPPPPLPPGRAAVPYATPVTPAASSRLTTLGVLSIVFAAVAAIAYVGVLLFDLVAWDLAQTNLGTGRRRRLSAGQTLSWQLRVTTRAAMILSWGTLVVAAAVALNRRGDRLPRLWAWLHLAVAGLTAATLTTATWTLTARSAGGDDELFITLWALAELAMNLVWPTLLLILLRSR